MKKSLYIKILDILVDNTKISINGFSRETSVSGLFSAAKKLEYLFKKELKARKYVK